MATSARRTSTGAVAVAAIVLALSLFSLPIASDACGGCNSCPCHTPSASPPTTKPPSGGGGGGGGGGGKYPPSANPPSGGGGKGPPSVSPPSSGGGGMCPPPAIPPSGGGKCPVDALKLGACANVLGGLVNLVVGTAGSPTSSTQCCELVGGLADLDAAVCLCTALRANVLGVVDLNLGAQLSLLVNYCQKKLPAGFQCADN